MLRHADPMNNTDTIRTGCVRVESWDQGDFWRVVLDKPKTNPLDDEVVTNLIEVFERAAAPSEETARLRSILITAEGDHFSTGAPPECFLPENAATSLALWLRLARLVLDCPVFTVACIHGHTMGRGMELSQLCDRVYADPDARMGVPEIEMGLFPPVASVLLPEKIGRSAAVVMCGTGYKKPAQEAHWMTLVDHVFADPEQFAILEVRHFLANLSKTGIVHVLRAVDATRRQRIHDGLDAAGRIFLECLQTADAQEGVRAAIERRPPVWTHR